MNQPSRPSVSVPLTALEPGQQGTICALCFPDRSDGPHLDALHFDASRPDALRRRLQDLGFVPGAKVCCVGVSPLGDPAAYRLKGTVIALRAGDAEAVLIRKEPGRMRL